MTGHMSTWVLAGALGLAVLGGCKKNQPMTQAPPPPVADAPPPPDSYSTGTGYGAAAQPTAAPEPVFVPTPQPAAAPGSGQTYVVQKGDTLMSIARKIYGNPGKFRDIAAANGISDPNKIKVGQTLVLP